jgi:hypothetical protein
MTPLDKNLKRLVRINGDDYVITLSPMSLKLTQKGRRQGLELLWNDLISGEAALATALHASLGRFPTDRPVPSEGGHKNRQPSHSARESRRLVSSKRAKATRRRLASP